MNDFIDKFDFTVAYFIEIGEKRSDLNSDFLPALLKQGGVVVSLNRNAEVSLGRPGYNRLDTRKRRVVLFQNEPIFKKNWSNFGSMYSYILECEKLEVVRDYPLSTLDYGNENLSLYFKRGFSLPLTKEECVRAWQKIRALKGFDNSILQKAEKFSEY